MSDKDPRRRFNTSERVALYLAADGHCTNCGSELKPGWHGDHVTPHAAGGPTDVINGQALCPSCNLKKGGPRDMPHLRTWQTQATEVFYAQADRKRDFLISATPGAGKTTFALNLASELRSQGEVDRIVVIVPTDALRRQWADAAAAFGLELKPVEDPEDYDKTGYHGCVATYQQLLGVGADLMRRSTRRPTVALIDEVHHAGENKSWGESLQKALERARYRLGLTGTPWRKDNKSPIPFVKYDEDATVIVDYAYEYGEAVTDGVCRHIEFHSYDGEARWIDPARARRTPKGDTSEVQVEFTAKLGARMSADDVSAALDTVYEPKHNWMPKVIAQANAMLDELREEIPDAAGLVVAERQWHAHGYAKLIEELTGTKPPVVISDPKADPGGRIAKQTIDRFRNGKDRWIVAVKMISEGVDIPRLAVGVYASKTQTPLFFRQVVGRFVRTRDEEEFNARLLIPAVPELLRHAIEIEDELRHQLDLAEEEERAAAEREGGGDSQGMLDFRTPLSASEAVFDRAILSGREMTPEELAMAEEKCRMLGVPTRYATNLMPLLRQTESPDTPTVPPEPAAQAPAQVARHKREKLLRQEVETLVRRYSYRSGREPREVNAELLRQGHPRRKEATVEQLEKINQTLLRWIGEPQA